MMMREFRQEEAMNEKTKKIIRVVYYVLVTLMLAVAAVLLMEACVGIYRTGDHPFTREVVAAALDSIAVPLYVCLGLLAVGIILHPLLPTADEADPDRDRAVLKRLLSRDVGEVCSPELAAAIRKEHNSRLLHRGITLGLLAVGAAGFLWYALDFAHFTMENINGSMIAAMWVLLPCVGIPFAYGVFTAYYGRVSIRREIALLRQLPGQPAPAPAPKKAVGITVARCVIIGVAIGFIAGGLTYDGWADVLTKAINICTECIGLG